MNGGFDWSTAIGTFSFPGCAGSPDFNLNANPNALTIAQGSNGTSTITVNPLNGFNGSVTLNATGLPSGVTAAFNPNPTTTTSTLTLTAAANATPGTSTITITGTSGSLSHQTTLQLTVTANGAVVTLTPTSLKWGKILVGVTSGSKKVTVLNSGTSALTITNIGTTGDFALVALSTKTACKLNTPVAAGKSCIVKVTFTPTQTGLRTGTLSFTDNAPGSPQTVGLSGTGK